jgi:hypothetical protein
MAVFGIATPVAGDPFFDSGAIERCRIETHGFRVGENASQCVGVVTGELAQDQPWCLEDLRGPVQGFFLRTLFVNSFRGARSDYNLRDGFPE